MMPYSRTITATGAQPAFAPDIMQSPFNLSAGVVLLAGATATYGIEFTLDDVNDPSAVWFPDANLAPGQTANGVTNYMFPVRGIRVNVTALTGTIRFTILQSV